MPTTTTTTSQLQGRRSHEPHQSNVKKTDIRVLLVVSNLEYGGAQRQVVELANRLNANGVDTHVASLSNYVPLRESMINAGNRLHLIPKRGKFDFSVVARLTDLLRSLKINILHAFLIDAEIASRLAGRRYRKAVVIGSERNCNYKRKWRHVLALRLTKRCVAAIIANSQAGKSFYARTRRLPHDKLFVVRNGVDAERFRPIESKQTRTAMGFQPTDKVVGMFCSFKRQKNHAMFFRMAKRVLQATPTAKFLCVGGSLHQGLQGSNRYHDDMLAMIKRLGLEEAIHCTGNCDDLSELYNLCDVTVLTSCREGTPNVLLESMACGVPVVATDVADNAVIVPDARVGFIVPYDDDQAMAARVTDLLQNTTLKETLGREARRWMQHNFSTEQLAQNTLDVYQQVLRRATV